MSSSRASAAASRRSRPASSPSSCARRRYPFAPIERRADVVREAGQVALELLLAALAVQPLLLRSVQLGVHRLGQLGERPPGRLHRHPRVAARLPPAQKPCHAAQLPAKEERRDSRSYGEACDSHQHIRHPHALRILHAPPPAHRERERRARNSDRSEHDKPLHRWRQPGRRRRARFEQARSSRRQPLLHGQRQPLHRVAHQRHGRREHGGRREQHRPEEPRGHDELRTRRRPPSRCASPTQ